MKVAVVIAFTIACQSGSSNPAQIDSGGRPPCQVPPLCGGSACGNNTLDSCYVQLMPGHCYFVPSMERCDGSAGVPSCSALGFYGGGTVACRDCLWTDDAACDACPPSTTCTTYPSLATQGNLAMVASGGRVALAGYLHVVIFDGNTEIKRVPFPYSPGLASIANGWMVVHGDTVTTIDTAGNELTNHTLANEMATTQLVSGPGGRVLAAWRRAVGSAPVSWRVFFAILDSDGTVIVAPTDLLPATADFALSSDGTSFFVGSNGTLARVAIDGSATFTSGFPTSSTGSTTTLTWSGTTGWYVTNSPATAQRFDAGGALLGSSIPMSLTGSKLDFVADGNDLLVLRANTKLVLERMSTAGVFSAPVEVGGGSVSYGRVVRVGSNAVVTWTRTSHLHAALVAL